MEIVTAFVLIPVVGEFFVELAKEFHLYEHPWPKVEGAMNTLIALANNPTYRIVAALVSLIDSFGEQLSQVFMLRVFDVDTNC